MTNEKSTIDVMKILEKYDRQDRIETIPKKKKIAIIGAGWYGCYLATALTREGHDITVYEEKADIMSGITGEFSIRLHSGLHYPRSEQTRENCRRGMEHFEQHFKELIIETDAYYGLGNKDAEDHPSQVDSTTLNKVCEEYQEPKYRLQHLDPEESEFRNLIDTIKIYEPSITIGNRLRAAFKKYLQAAHVNLKLNCKVVEIQNNDHAAQIIDDAGTVETFDKVINATNFQAFIPKGPLPNNIEVKYQPCLSLIYKDKQPQKNPVSFIVIDGWFPCLMPRVFEMEKDAPTTREYSLTHGKWTILKSTNTPQEAYQVLHDINSDWVETHIKPFAAAEMTRFWPQFSERFEYTGWKSAVVVKPYTLTEFRSAITFEQKNILHIIPGKISNIFDVANEIITLLENDEEKNISTKGGYRYARHGVLDSGIKELTEKPAPGTKNTCHLNTYDEIQKAKKIQLKPKRNEYFKLNCFIQVSLSSALLGLLLCIIPVVGVPLFAVGITLTLCGLGCSAYGFFAQKRKQERPPSPNPNTLYALRT